jgi:archaellum biogenesis ATPase FlaH
MNNFKIDDIKPEFHKAWHYANNFMITAVKTESHCKQFLQQSNKWSICEKEFLFWVWMLIVEGINIDPTYASNEVLTSSKYEGIYEEEMTEKTVEGIESIVEALALEMEEEIEEVKEISSKPRPRPEFKKQKQSK